MSGINPFDDMTRDLVEAYAEVTSKPKIDAAVMARLRAPFGCELVLGQPRRNNFGDMPGIKRWRIHDANDDAIASVNQTEEGYARLIVQALNELFERRK